MDRFDAITITALGLADSWSFGEGAKSRAVSIRSRLAVNTAEAAIDAAMAGLGVTRVLSYQVAEKVQAGQLMLALQDFAPPSVPVSLVYNGQGILPLKVRAFLDFATPKLKAGLAG